MQSTIKKPERECEVSDDKQSNHTRKQPRLLPNRCNSTPGLEEAHTNEHREMVLHHDPAARAAFIECQCLQNHPVLDKICSSAVRLRKTRSSAPLTPLWRRNSSRVPTATSFPWCMMPMRSAISSATLS